MLSQIEANYIMQKAASDANYNFQAVNNSYYDPNLAYAKQANAIDSITAKLHEIKNAISEVVGHTAHKLGLSSEVTAQLEHTAHSHFGVIGEIPSFEELSKPAAPGAASSGWHDHLTKTKAQIYDEATNLMNKISGHASYAGDYASHLANKAKGYGSNLGGQIASGYNSAYGAVAPHVTLRNAGIAAGVGAGLGLGGYGIHQMMQPQQQGY